MWYIIESKKPVELCMHTISKCEKKKLFSKIFIKGTHFSEKGVNFFTNTILLYNKSNHKSSMLLLAVIVNIKHIKQKCNNGFKQNLNNDLHIIVVGKRKTKRNIQDPTCLHYDIIHTWL